MFPQTSKRLIVLSATLVIACATTNVPLARSTDRVVRQHRCILTVKNRHWNDVEVFVAMGSTRVRLDRVISGATKTLHIPQGMVGGSVRLELRPTGGARHSATSAVYFGPGQELELWVSADITKSSSHTW